GMARQAAQTRLAPGPGEPSRFAMAALHAMWQLDVAVQAEQLGNQSADGAERRRQHQREPQIPILQPASECLRIEVRGDAQHPQPSNSAACPHGGTGSREMRRAGESSDVTRYNRCLA